MYEMKPRKAKYGFSLTLAGIAREILAECRKMDKLVEALDEFPEGKETWWLETPNGMGTVSINVYINDLAIYEKAKATFESLK